MPPSNIFSALRAISRKPLISRALPSQRQTLAQFSTSRFYSQSTSPIPPPSSTSSKPKRPATTIPRPQVKVPPKAPPPTKPSYEMTFTCTPCSTRSTHLVSKQGYHKGSVLITCPECKNRHVISDHLNIFGDRDITIEDLMRERGQIVKKGTLSEDGDVEFWEDGSETARKSGEPLKPSEGAAQIE